MPRAHSDTHSFEVFSPQPSESSKSHHPQRCCYCHGTSASNSWSTSAITAPFASSSCSSSSMVLRGFQRRPDTQTRLTLPATTQNDPVMSTSHQQSSLSSLVSPWFCRSSEVSRDVLPRRTPRQTPSRQSRIDAFKV